MKRAATPSTMSSPHMRVLHLFGWLLLCAILLPGMRSAHAAAPDIQRVAHCSWDRPGHDPYMGDVVAAVDRYKDIPVTIRKRLKERMADRNFDEYVTISRDSIQGQNYYESRIADMHFGTNRVCRNVSRAGWTESMRQAGLVYCEQNHCILVPTVCRNVSRIVRIASSGPAMTGQTVGFIDMPGIAEGLDDPVAADFALDRLPPAVVGRNRPGPVSDSLTGTPVTPPGLGILPGSPFGPVITGPAAPVPEPQEWLMYLAGLGVIGWVARRRTRRAAE